ncbi:MAG: NAD(P)/FAD-dependent oxidoreductase [Pseudomonadota bacterium]
MRGYDHVVVGSGVNALVCAALLAEDHRVLVLEREDVVGGTMRTGTLAEGFTYDPMAATFLLMHASPVYAELSKALARHGVSFATTDTPTGVLMADGRSAVLTRDRAANIAAFNGLHAGAGDTHGEEMGAVEANAALLFGLFNNRLLSLKALTLMAGQLWSRGPRALRASLGEALATNRHRLDVYGDDPVAALNAPWPLHAGLGPEQPFSGQMGQIMTFALEAMGAPIGKGGAARVAEGLRAIIEERRGVVRTGADVDKIDQGSDGRHVARIHLADGESIDCDSVICSVTPGQLYGRLLREWDLPEATRAAGRYAKGRGNMQIHYALERPVDWPDPALASVQLLHLCDGVDQVSKATNEADRGVLPERPTVCVGQPSAADPSRCPDGKAVLWVQLPECPRVVKGDAAGTIAVEADGAWSEAVREAYADRVEAMIEAHAPGFGETVIARKAYAPTDLEAMNINLEGGDPYGGWCGVDQFFLFRPFGLHKNHNSAVPGVYHIGASTHPGPGLSGMSGYLLAKHLK